MLKRAAIVLTSIAGLTLSAMQAVPAVQRWPIFGIVGGGLLLTVLVWGAWELIERRGDGRPYFHGELFDCHHEGFTGHGIAYGGLKYSSSGFTGRLFLVNKGSRTTLRKVFLDGSALDPRASFVEIEIIDQHIYEPGIGHELTIFAEATFYCEQELWPEWVYLDRLGIEVVDALGHKHTIKARKGECFRPAG